LCRPRGWDGGGELFFGVDDVYGALLELDGVATSSDGDGDEALCEIDIAIVVNADFGDDVAGLTCTE